MHEKLEKLKHDLYVGEQKLRAAENEGKALQRELLTFLFHGEAAQKKLDMLIENRRKARWADEG